MNRRLALGIADSGAKVAAPRTSANGTSSQRIPGVRCANPGATYTSARPPQSGARTVGNLRRCTCACSAPPTSSIVDSRAAAGFLPAGSFPGFRRRRHGTARTVHPELRSAGRWRPCQCLGRSSLPTPSAASMIRLESCLIRCSRMRSSWFRIRRPNFASDSSPRAGTFLRRSSGSGRIRNDLSTWYRSRIVFSRRSERPPAPRIAFSLAFQHAYASASLPDGRRPIRGRMNRRSQCRCRCHSGTAPATDSPRVDAACSCQRQRRPPDVRRLCEADRGAASICFFRTDFRTGAAGGLAAKYLARPDASRVGLIGAGAQARTQLAAILKVRPIREVVVFDRHLAHSQAFADHVTGHLWGGGPGRGRRPRTRSGTWTSWSPPPPATRPWS